MSHPPSVPGLRIGLLGGSFNPPHAGHALITRIALKRLRLDRVWWMFSPGNPLKAESPAQTEARIEAAKALCHDRRVVLTDIEARLGTRYTADTLGVLKRRYRGTAFVWLMGEDNLAQFHHWEDWRAIASTIPIAVFSRPGNGFAVLNAPMTRTFRSQRQSAFAAGAIASAKPPAWIHLRHPQSELSSTALRKRGDWP